MNNTGSQVVKVAVPAIALTGTGIFGSIIVGAIVGLGITGVFVLAGDAFHHFIKSRRAARPIEATP